MKSTFPPCSYRVLLVSVSHEFGGAETYYVKLARMLAERVEVVAVVSNQELAGRLREAGASEVKLVPPGAGPDGRYRATAAALHRAVRSFRPDFVHLNGQHATYLAPIVRLLGTRFAVTRHNPLDEPPLRPRIKKSFILNQLRAAQCVIAVSEEIFGELSPLLEPQKLVHIPTWVPDASGSERSATAFHAPLKLLFLGRLIPEKGVQDLIAALRGLPGVTLDVVGEGPLLEPCKAGAVDLPVTFHGFRSDGQQFLEDADLLVFPSREGYEGLPQVPLEAMAAGIPCLLADIKATRELTRGTKAMFFSAGDPEDLARTISALQGQPELLAELSREGLRNVRAHFTEASVLPKYVAAFAIPDSSTAP